MKIWMLVIGHRFGTNMYPCATADIAKRELEKYVHEWWEQTNLEDISECHKDEVIDNYFEAMSDTEWYEMDVLDLIEE